MTLEKLQMEKASALTRSLINSIYIFAVICIGGPPIFGVSGFLYGELIGKRLLFDLPFDAALIFSVPISYYLGITHTVMLALYFTARNAFGWVLGSVEATLCALLIAATVPPTLVFGNWEYGTDQFIRFGPPLVLEALTLWYILLKVRLLRKGEATP